MDKDTRSYVMRFCSDYKSVRRGQKKRSDVWLYWREHGVLPDICSEEVPRTEAERMKLGAITVQELYDELQPTTKEIISELDEKLRILKILEECP